MQSGRRLGKASSLAQLHRQLYVAASFCVNKDFRNDGDAVRAKRDYTINELFHTNYKQLDKDQLNHAIQVMQVESGFMDAGQLSDELFEKITKPAVIIASAKQIRTLRMYAINCALVYCDFSEASFYDPKDNDTYYGEDARRIVKDMFERGAGVPDTILSYIFSKWINPKAHKFMIEAKFKKRVIDDTKFHYEYLHANQADKLIQRFASIWQNVSKRDYKPELGSLSTN